MGPAATPLDFYTNPTAQGYYRDHVKTVINRVNTINGRPCEAPCWPALGMHTTAKLWHCPSTFFPRGALQLCIYKMAPWCRVEDLSAPSSATIKCQVWYCQQCLLRLALKSMTNLPFLRLIAGLLT